MAPKGLHDARETKLNASGSALAYSTYLGGTDQDRGLDIAVREGRAYVTGYTFSTDYPTTPGAFDTSFNSPSLNGLEDAFVTKVRTG